METLTYTDFLQLSEALGLSEKITEEEYNKCMHFEIDEREELSSHPAPSVVYDGKGGFDVNLGFVNGMSIFRPKVSPVAKYTVEGIDKLTNEISSFSSEALVANDYSGIPEAAIRQAAETLLVNRGLDSKLAKIGTGIVTEAIKAATSKVFELRKGDPNDENYGGGPTGPTDPRSGRSMMHVGLVETSSPIEVKLNSGLANVGIGRYLGITDLAVQYSPLHVTFARLSLYGEVGTNLSKYYEDVINVVLRNIVINRLNYKATFDATKVRTYFNNIFLALQIYYWHNSLFSITNKSGFVEPALQNIRDQVSVDSINQFYRLGRILTSFSFPPRLFDLAYYSMQFYRSSHLPGSSILSIVPFTFDVNVNGNPIYDQGAMGQALAFLENSDVIDASKEINRAFPEWYRSDLPASSPELLHDENFTTIFSNLPFKAKNGNQVGNIVASTTEEIGYSSFTNEVDPLAYMFLNVINVAEGQGTFSGLVQSLHVGNAISNRASSTATDNSLVDLQNSSLLDTIALNRIAINRPECHVLGNNDPVAVYKVAPSGTEVIYKLSIANLERTGYNAIDYLFNLSDLPNTTPGGNAKIITRTSPLEKISNKEGKTRGSNVKRSRSKPNPKFKSKSKKEE